MPALVVEEGAPERRKPTSLVFAVSWPLSISPRLFSPCQGQRLQGRLLPPTRLLVLDGGDKGLWREDDGVAPGDPSPVVDLPPPAVPLPWSLAAPSTGKEAGE